MKGDPKDLLGKVPPQDLDAERALLGALMLSSEAYDNVYASISKDMFYADAHRRVFESIKAVVDKRPDKTSKVDIVILANELHQRGDLSEAGGPAYLNDLMAAVAHASNADYYAAIVRKCYFLREIINAATDTLRDAYHGNPSDIEDIFQAVDSRFQGVSESLYGYSMGGPATLADVADETMDKIFARMDAADSTAEVVNLGYVDVDRRLNGLHPSEFCVIAARPSVGKTAFVCNVLCNNQDLPTLFVTLEQSRAELLERMYVIRSGIEGAQLRSGKLDEFAQGGLMESHEAFCKNRNIFISDAVPQSIGRVYADARRLKRQHGIKLLVVDYLQLVEPDPNDERLQRDQQIAKISRTFKYIAKNLQIPVVCLSQLNRATESRSDPRPKLADIRGSGAIEQDADSVIALHRPELYKSDDRPGEAEVIILKNRHGPTGTATIKYVAGSFRFEERGIDF